MLDTLPIHARNSAGKLQSPPPPEDLTFTSSEPLAGFKQKNSPNYTLVT